MLDSELPPLRDIIAIEGEDVVTKDGEHIPLLLYEVQFEMRNGYVIRETDEKVFNEKNK